MSDIQDIERPDEDAPSLTERHLKKLDVLLDTAIELMERVKDSGGDAQETVQAVNAARQLISTASDISHRARRLNLWESAQATTTAQAQAESLDDVYSLMAGNKRDSEILRQVLDGNLSIEAAKAELEAA